MKQQHDRMLGTEQIGTLLVRMSVPATVAMFVHALYNLVDTIYIARGVGTEAIGGLTIAFPFQMIVMAFAMMIGMGTASVVSRNLGAGNRERAYRATGNTFSISTVFGIIMTVCGYLFIDPILKLFGATPLLMEYARDYLSIILSGTFFITFSMSANNILRAEGKATVAMITMILGAVLNIILDPVFIFGLKMGIKGAALATVISQFFSFAFLLYFLSIGFFLLILIPGPIFRIFSTDISLINTGIPVLRVIILIIPFIGVQVIGASYFQAIGKAGPAFFLGLSRQFILLIPLMLSLPLVFGLWGIFIAYPAADFLSTLITGIWLLQDVRSLPESQREEPIPVGYAAK